MTITRRSLFASLGLAALSKYLPHLEAGQEVPESSLSSRLREAADVLESPSKILRKYELIACMDNKLVLPLDVTDIERIDADDGRACISWKTTTKIKQDCTVNQLRLVSPNGTVWRARTIGGTMNFKAGDTLHLSYNFAFDWKC